MKIRYGLDRGYTYWGEPIGMKFRVWRNVMRVTGNGRLMTWRMFNFQWRGVLLKIDVITEHKHGIE